MRCDVCVMCDVAGCKGGRDLHRDDGSMADG